VLRGSREQVRQSPTLVFPSQGITAKRFASVQFSNIATHTGEDRAKEFLGRVIASCKSLTTFQVEMPRDGSKDPGTLTLVSQREERCRSTKRA
jgi:hypothetical protein